VNNLAAEFDYTYNLDGSPATLKYPSARMLTYTVKGAGRVTDIKDVANNVNYATGATYAPPGELATVIDGTSSVGITVTDSYNKRLQPSVLQADTNGSGTHTIFSRSYGFQLGTADNGVVYQIVNGLDGNRTQNFTYDNLNRITQANTTGPSWGEKFKVDAWGNLTNRDPVSGKNNSEPLNAAVNTNNQVVGLGYDIAGNLSTNGSATYIYDAHNRLISASGYTYGYDANGERVKKSVPTGQPATLYLHGPGGETLAETDASGNLLNEYIFFNGERIARRDAPSGTVHYYFADHLGSASLITDASGNVQKEADYYPYGGEIVISGSDANHYKFTGKERDETGLDEFGARYYSSQMGRFMTADWGAIPMAVPYAVLGNPQTLNLYSYVENNPATSTDPDGHVPPDGLYHGDAFGGASISGDDVGNFFAGLGNALSSDNLAGFGRQDQSTTAGQVGAATGDFLAVVQGSIEFLTGGTTAAGGVAACGTGVGCLATAPAVAAGTAVAAHAATTGSEGLSHLFFSAEKAGEGAGKTSHGEQRANEAKAGDTHRQVGDANRTIQEGRRFRDTETGHTVHVRGDRVVITNSEGKQVTQFKNSAANTQQRIESGKWEPLN
jgi:RHS repeat-associated protein